MIPKLAVLALSAVFLTLAALGTASASVVTLRSLEDQGYLLRSVAFDAQNDFNLFLQKADGGPIYVCGYQMTAGPAIEGCFPVADVTH